MSYRVHTPDTAPDDAGETLAAVKEKFGFLPNIVGVMGNSPALAKAYATIGQLFESTSLSPAEQQVVLLAASLENGCEYCMSAHSMVAEKAGLSDDAVQALREGRDIDDPKLAALQKLTRAVVVERGHPDADRVKDFLDAGYDESQVLEVLVGVGMKTLSNYTHSLTDVELDEVFEGHRWSAAEARA